MLNIIKAKLSQKLWSAIFTINPKLLGDKNSLAWTNLGLWHDIEDDYISAATRLANQMGLSLALKPTDRILDIGCGHGASLAYWSRHFAVQHISAMELQKQCCEKIQAQQLPFIQHIFHQSLFHKNLAIQAKPYDVILTIDATYHYALNDYLQAINAWLKPDGRIGFHFLCLSNEFNNLSLSHQQEIKKQLKWAKVDVQQLYDKTSLQIALQQYGFQNIEILDLTEQVFKGFSNYFFARPFNWQARLSLDYLKIKMTAQLCENLARDGQIRYVQVTAQKII